jgi:hypothetical protein
VDAIASTMLMRSSFSVVALPSLGLARDVAAQGALAIFREFDRIAKDAAIEGLGESCA